MPLPVASPDTVRPVHAVVFDMDGTLVQARHSSWQVFRDVSDEFGLGIDSPEAYYELFRGNVYAELAKRCDDPEEFDRVKQSLLERLSRDYHPVMIPGMVHVVRRLAGVSTLALLSSNALPVMRRVLVENDLAFCFSHVFAGDTVADKRTAIRQLLADTASGFGRRCSAEYDEEMVPEQVAAAGTVLVTDTAGDVEEALAEGARAVGVAWGMHSVQQLTAAGAEFVALWPQEVGAYLTRGIDAAPRGSCEVLPARTDTSATAAKAAQPRTVESCAGCPVGCPRASTGARACVTSEVGMWGAPGSSGDGTTRRAAAALPPAASPGGGRLSGAPARAVRTERRARAVDRLLARSTTLPTSDERHVGGTTVRPQQQPSVELVAALRRTCR